jgi:hypothetical protein
MSPQQLVQAVRGKDPMRGLCASRQITDEGCDWLKFALDPFHDLQLDNLKGYPDVNTEPTVIVKIRQAVEISKPTDLEAGKNWDCHLALSPIDWARPNDTIRHNNDSGFNAAGLVLPQGTTSIGTAPVGAPAGLLANIGGSSGDKVTARMDGLVINSVPAGAANGGDMTFTPGHCPREAKNGYAVENIVLDKYLDFSPTDLGVYRIVYSGFEVVNTTAQIHKQGAVTVYEYGHSYETSQIAGSGDHGSTDNGGIDPRHQSYAANSFRSPPNTIAEAKIMPGAHTWAAQDGCYCTAKFIGDNPFQAATMRNYVIQQNQKSGEADSGYNPITELPEYGCGSFVSPGLIGNSFPVTGADLGIASLPAYTAAPATHFSRMSTAGAYFTGLSPESTLFVTWRVGLERLPAANKPTFLALAQPSATFDPNALLLYNLIANHLPPGCPQGWNDLGKWFNTIANVAKNVIPGAFPLVSTAQMLLHGMGATKQAQALPGAIQGMRDVGAIVQRNSIAGQQRQRAAKQIQAAQRAAAQRRNKPKQAVQNFGQPGVRRQQRIQQFGQMS